MEIKASFYCAICNNLAATIELLPDEKSGWKLEFDGFLGKITSYGKNLIDFAALIIAEDASALHRANFEYAPFYCPECQVCYCSQHWTTEMVFDDDWTDWYDCTYGTCPKGHRHIIDD